MKNEFQTTGVDEAATVYNGHYEVEVVIDRPIAQVWKQYLKIDSWVTSHKIENVKGEPGTLGSITRVSFGKAEAQDLPPARYHYCKIVKLIPEQQYVLKTYSEKGGSYGWTFVAFDDARFIDLGGRTRIVFNLFVTYDAEIAAKDPDFMPRATEVSRQGMVENFNRLKRMVESA